MSVITAFQDRTLGLGNTAPCAVAVPPTRRATTMDSISRSLITAQNKAQALFDEVAGGGLIQAGKLESELTAEIHALAHSRFGLRRHWHRRIARSGPNTLLTYHEDSED